MKKDFAVKFISADHFVLIGASRNNKKFGNTLLKILVKSGKKVVPLHHEADEINGIKTVMDISEVPDYIHNLIFCIKPEKVKSILPSAVAHGIRRVWFQLGSESAEAENYCKENSIEYSTNECLLLHLKEAGFPHNFHSWINKLLKK